MVHNLLPFYGSNVQGGIYYFHDLETEHVWNVEGISRVTMHVTKLH